MPNSIIEEREQPTSIVLKGEDNCDLWNNELGETGRKRSTINELLRALGPLLRDPKRSALTFAAITERKLIITFPGDPGLHHFNPDEINRS